MDILNDNLLCGQGHFVTDMEGDIFTSASFNFYTLLIRRDKRES